MSTAGRNSLHVVQDRDILPMENLMGIAVLFAERMGLSFAECFEPEAFSRQDVWSPLNGTVRIIGKDRSGWATVTGFTALGNVVLRPDEPPLQPAGEGVRPMAKRQTS
jgi:hypothetical protein